MCGAFSFVLRKLQPVFSHSHRISGWVRLEAPLEVTLPSPLLHQGHPEPAAQDVSRWLLSLSRDGDSTTSVGTCTSARPPSQCRSVS